MKNSTLEERIAFHSLVAGPFCYVDDPPGWVVYPPSRAEDRDPVSEAHFEPYLRRARIKFNPRDWKVIYGSSGLAHRPLPR